MKLVNKKTGEIAQACYFASSDGAMILQDANDLDNVIVKYKSLTELNEEWEDAPEEPKEYWYASDNGYICTHIEDGDSWDEHRKEIGNYFETKEEAEKAVERLRAWKRLKDKGFRFIDHIDRDAGQGMTRYEWDGYVNGEDLDLLFSGGEE